MANNLYVAAYDATATATWARADLANTRNGFSSTGYITSTVDTNVRTDSGDETGTLPQFQTSTPYKLWAIADDGTTSSSLVSSAEFVTPKKFINVARPWTQQPQATVSAYILNPLTSGLMVLETPSISKLVGLPKNTTATGVSWKTLNTNASSSLRLITVLPRTLSTFTALILGNTYQGVSLRRGHW